MTLEHPVDTPAGELLRSAREAAWSDDESVAADAYACAIRAIEQAFRQIATPDNPTTDLGVILAHYEDCPDLWNSRCLRVSDLDPIMSLLNGLWQGRPQPDDLFPIRLEHARIAITIAEAVVNLAELGFFELLDELTPDEEAEDLRIVEEYEERKRRGELEEPIPSEEFVAKHWTDNADPQPSTSEPYRLMIDLRAARQLLRELDSRGDL